MAQNDGFSQNKLQRSYNTNQISNNYKNYKHTDKTKESSKTKAFSIASSLGMDWAYSTDRRTAQGSKRMKLSACTWCNITNNENINHTMTLSRINLKNAGIKARQNNDPLQCKIPNAAAVYNSFKVLATIQIWDTQNTCVHNNLINDATEFTTCYTNQPMKALYSQTDRVIVAYVPAGLGLQDLDAMPGKVSYFQLLTFRANHL